MATDPHRLPFYSRLRESLIASYIDKTTIRSVAQDAGIDWADVIPDGSPRSAWNDVLLNARRQRRVRQLIEITAKQYPNNEGLQQALTEFDPAEEIVATNTEVDELSEAIVSLDIGEVDSPIVNVELLGFANGIPMQMLQLAFSGQSATPSQFAAVSSGSRTRSALSDRDRFESAENTRRSVLQRSAQRAEADFAKMGSKVREIEAEQRPSPPKPPQYLNGFPGPGDPEYSNIVNDSVARQQYIDRRDRINEERKINFEAAIRRHEAALENYKKRQQDLLGYRSEVNQLRQQVNQCNFEIARFEREFADGMQRHNREIEAARSRDVVQLLADLGTSSARDLSDNKNAARGYIAAISIHIIYSFAQKWLDPSSAAAAKQITKDADENADAAVRSRHCSIGGELLRRFGTISGAEDRFANEVQTIRTLLNTLPVGELARARSAFDDKLNEKEFPPVPNYDNVVGPVEYNLTVEALAEMRKGIVAAKESRQMLLDETSDLLTQAAAARGRAEVHCARIDAEKEELKAFLVEATCIWKILGIAEQEAEASRAFTVVLQKETLRRFERFAKVVTACEHGEFLPNEGKNILSDHVSESFSDKRNEVVSQLGDLAKIDQEYEFALKDIVHVPCRIAIKSSKWLTIFAVGCAVPVLNVFCVALFLRRVLSLRAWLHSVFPEFRDVLILAQKLTFAIGAMSLVFGFVLFGVLDLASAAHSIVTPTAKTLVQIVGVSEALTGALALWCWVKL